MCLEKPSDNDCVKEYQDCFVSQGEESLFNSVAHLNSTQFFQMDIPGTEWSEEELLESVKAFQKNNVFPPRLNLWVYKQKRYNSLRKLASLYPTTHFNGLLLFSCGDISDLPKWNLNLNTLEFA